jgi:hypothetical protein
MERHITMSFAHQPLNFKTQDRELSSWVHHVVISITFLAANRRSQPHRSPTRSLPTSLPASGEIPIADALFD